MALPVIACDNVGYVRITNVVGMNQKRCELCVLLPYLFDFRLRQKLGQFLSAKVRVNFKAAGAVKRVSLTAASNASPRCGT